VASMTGRNNTLFSVLKIFRNIFGSRPSCYLMRVEVKLRAGGVRARARVCVCICVKLSNHHYLAVGLRMLGRTPSWCCA